MELCSSLAAASHFLSELDVEGAAAAGVADELESLEAGAAVDSLLDEAAAEESDELPESLLLSLLEAAGLALP